MSAGAVAAGRDRARDAPPAAAPAARPRCLRRGRDRLDPLRRLLDRLVASPAFREQAARLPLGRLIARRRAGDLFDLSSGFVHTQVLAAVARLDLPRLLLRPQTASELAQRLTLPAAPLERLCEAATALELLSRRGRHRYGLGRLGAALVDNDGLLAMITHHAALWDDLRDPVSLVHDGHGERLSRYWAYNADAPVADYTRLMSRSQPLIASSILDACSLRRHRHLLDLGGGDGSFLLAALQRWPHLEASLWERPEVLDQARARLAATAGDRQVRLLPGDLRCDAIPRGADIMSLVRVLHDHEDVVVRDLLLRVHQALPVGGRLLIAEPMAGNQPRDAVAAYFHMYFLAIGQGRLRTPRHLRRLLASVGFRNIRLLPSRLPVLARIVLATA